MKHMRYLLLLLSVFVGSTVSVHAQLLDAVALDTMRTYKSLERALKEPELVYRLDLSGQKLKMIPEELYRLTNLNALDLSGNKLKELPDRLGAWRELVSLDLWDNDLADFPEEMSEMTALRFMDLRAIQFEEPEMEHLMGLLPKAKIYFSQPCNCGM